MQRLVEINIEKLSLGGSGVGRCQGGELDGLVVFVPFSAPGDFLKIEIVEQKKNFAEGKIVEILKPSLSRRPAPCVVFGRCGGCNWQHLLYQEQLRQKQQVVEEQLSKFLKKKVEVLPIIPSPTEWNYRNRIQIKKKNGKVGFFARKSHDLVEVSECLIAENEINQRLLKIKDDQFDNLQLSLDDEDEQFGFSQVNRFQNENLVNTVLAWAREINFTEIYDLYAGSGNFSFVLAKEFHKAIMTAVELNADSVAWAQKLIRDSNISPKKFRFILGDVGLFLKRNILNENSLIVLDPPRTGCSESSIRSLGQQKFKKLLYISCNPATLGRDLERLFEFSPHKLRLQKIQPFDMFPQTDHVEVLTELVIDT